MLKYAFIIFILFTTSSVFVFVNVWVFSDRIESAALTRDHPRNIENIDDYDSACSGHSFGEIIRTQKRILKSVQEELLQSQAKLDEVMKVHAELQRLIPKRQLELSTVEGEIEAAQRQLEELRENRNVRVSLPLSPLELPPRIKTKKTSSWSFEDLIDFSRCSITSFMPISITNLDDSWTKLIKVTENVVFSSEKACLQVVNGTITTGSNLLVFNYGKILESFDGILIQPFVSVGRRKIDISALMDVPETENLWQELAPLLPYSREVFLCFLLEKSSNLPVDVLVNSGVRSDDKMRIFVCNEDDDYCDGSSAQRVALYRTSMFCMVTSSENATYQLYDALRTSCVPVILGDLVLPFEEMIDWRTAAVLVPTARLTEVHLILRSLEMSDVLEMRRRGRNIYEKYLGSRQALTKTVFALMRYRLQIPAKDVTSKAVPLFNGSFSSPNGVPANRQNPMDDAYLGPLEAPYDSATYVHNFSSLGLYAYQLWNHGSPWKTQEYLIGAHDPPAEAEFYPDSGLGFRPIDPGSGVEFSKALGGNQAREQFTIVLLTYERDPTLSDSLERLYQLPYLNKVIVVWNSVDREPPTTWPTLHVPVEFIKPPVNSLNNRFIPWDRIRTEAVLSLDDDIDLMQQELILAFRVWRENRDRIVGFPARYHARYGDSMFYNSNHTCQLSMILTGAAFIHKNYLDEYTNTMPSVIRSHVDKVQNCEDIAMNFLVAHLTRKPPIKTTSRWTLKCPTCTEALSQSESHFNERHECVRLFTTIYGYNPLKFSQFRADSILFKTRLPQHHQKCFTYV